MENDAEEVVQFGNFTDEERQRLFGEKIDAVKFTLRGSNKSTVGREAARAPSPPPPKTKTQPTSWAALFAKNNDPKSSPNNSPVAESTKKTADESSSSSSLPRETTKSKTKFSDALAEWKKTSKRLRSKPVHLVPRGLINRGNNCYIHTILQSLLACPSFYSIFKLFDPMCVPKGKGRSTTPIIDSFIQFVNEFEEGNPASAQKAKKSQTFQQGSAFEPKYLYEMLKKIDTTLLIRGRQEDAEEFLSCVLDGLHEEMVSQCDETEKDEIVSEEDVVQPKEADESATSENAEPAQDHEEKKDEEEEEWEEVGPKKKTAITRKTALKQSPISDLFGGVLHSSVRSHGAKESVTMEPFFSLKLDIQETSVWSVKDALDGLATKEALHGYTSSKTGEEVEASRRIAFAQLPPVLVLHLKRFVYDKTGGCQKVHKEIDYSLELEIGKDLVAESTRRKLSRDERTYKLFSVVYHHGKHANDGHYTCDVYSSTGGGWCRYDDNIIRVIHEQQVLKHSPGKVAYLLYYRRSDTT
ncbi:ubiquitin carboxyl-terminal hydrolase 10-like [Oscarella lobularis]|uniref:ubiquitin carboxyl-terminal hydrolase 10-like n=1 Tax=Oscarella lobularis TaxID=121494 RepID=UPI003313E414